MLLNPQSVPSQQPVLQALQQTVEQYPVCEAWILLLNDINDHWATLSPEGLRRVADVALNVAKVLRYIQKQAPASVLVYQYIQPLAIGAHDIGVYARLTSINATGAESVILTADAVGALTTLQQWDDVQGIYVPQHPGQLGLRLVRGVGVGS